MSFLIELKSATSPATFIIAQAASQASARALVDAELARDEDLEDVVIVAVHPIH